MAITMKRARAITITTITGTPMFAYDFAVNALLAGAIVAVTAGVVGVFLVMRGQAFAGHALAHVGFAGATGAALFGLPPLAGLLLFSFAGAGLMGALGERLQGRDVAMGMVLAAALGLGVLFLNLYTAHAVAANAVLFGNVFAATPELVATLAVLAVLCLGALAVIARPLLFASLQPEMAEAKGISPGRIGVFFLLIVAAAVAAAAQIVGVLLVFTLLIGPPASAGMLTTRLGPLVVLSALLAVFDAWGGVTLAYYTDWPASFWISALAALTYAASAAWSVLGLRAHH
jgi:zinc/manganese transport system permease protein